jgi:hypothetical protein
MACACTSPSVGVQGPDIGLRRTDCGGAISRFRTREIYVKHKRSSLERLEIYFRAAQNLGARPITSTVTSIACL